MLDRRNGPNKDNGIDRNGSSLFVYIYMYICKDKIKTRKIMAQCARVPSSLASSVCGAELEERSLLEGSELVV